MGGIGSKWKERDILQSIAGRWDIHLVFRGFRKVRQSPMRRHPSYAQSALCRVVLSCTSLAIERGPRGDVGVVLLDLDHFKQVNDTHGHLVGDHVLRDAAEIMSGTIRPYDAVGRFGGEEFLVILPGCDEINATSHAERLRAALQRIEVQSPKGAVSITASLGVTVVGPEARVDAPTAIQAADAAMYAANYWPKRRGKATQCPVHLHQPL